MTKPWKIRYHRALTPAKLRQAFEVAGDRAGEYVGEFAGQLKWLESDGVPEARCRTDGDVRCLSIPPDPAPGDTLMFALYHVDDARRTITILTLSGGGPSADRATASRPQDGPGREVWQLADYRRLHP